MQREHLMTAVLADDTRFGIYRCIAERPDEPFTVAEVAERIGLHPNVARMHLGKLEQAGLLTTTLRKAGTGGRPAKLYSLSGRIWTLAVPPRRYDLLAALALEALAQGGGSDAVDRVCRSGGQEAALQFLGERGLEPPLAGHPLAAGVQEVAEDQGLMPDVSWRDGGLSVEIRNCVFGGAAGCNHGLACTIHGSFLLGLVDALGGGPDEFVLEREGLSIGAGSQRCRLRFTRMPDGAA